MILWKILPDGDFVCGDTESKVTSYAFPRSPFATEAVKDPNGVALKMISAEKGTPNDFSKEYDVFNWKLLS